MKPIKKEKRPHGMQKKDCHIDWAENIENL